MNVRTRTDRSRQNEGWQRSPETMLAPTRFLLRSVRIALQATAVVLFVLAIYPTIPGHGTLDGPVYAALLGTGALAAFIAALLPWPRLFERGYGISVLVMWSAFDIVLITLAIAVTGSGRSELWLLYALIALFFAASYPRRAQVALLATTLVAYLGVLAATSWEISPARIVLRVAVLLLVAFLASFLSRELIEEAAGHDAARTESEHQAELAMAMNTRLVEAQEEERIRVARELHDDLGPLLASVSLFVRRLETERGEDEDLGLSTVRRIAELAVRRMRALAWSLRPVELDEIGLVPAVSRLASDVRLLHGMDVEVHARGLDSRLPLDLEANAYRIVQEALSNALQHAAARSISIVFVRSGDRFTTVVADDGRGFDPTAATEQHAGGIGLASMKERARHMGGELVVEASPSAGTIVSFRAEVRPDPANPGRAA